MPERRISLFLLAALTLLVALNLPAALPGSAPLPSEPEPDEPAGPSVQLGYFYKPTDQRTPVDELARRANFLILTKKDEAFRDELRAAGYTGDVLQYVMAAEVVGPEGALSAEAPCDEGFVLWHNQAAYEPGDFCGLLHGNDDWFLHNGSGERLYSLQSGSWFYHMNPANPGWRRFLVERLRRFLEGEGAEPPLGYDGVFLDNVELTLGKVLRLMSNSDGAVAEFADDESYRAAWEGLLAEISGALRPRWPIWANMVAGGTGEAGWESYLSHLDGGMNEAFATGWPDAPLGPARWEADLRQAEAALALDKGYLAVAQGGDGDDLQPFALASYLLVADGRASYFRYMRASEERYLRPYANEQVTLGRPKGARYLQADGTWRRDFARGFVVVDPVARTGQIATEEPDG